MGVRVLIVDPHTLFRQGVEALLRHARDVEVIGHAGSRSEALEKACALRPEVVLIDINMPIAEAIETIREIRLRCSDVNVLVLTEEDSPNSALRAIEAGAVGYVLKEIELSRLIDAIRHVANGMSMVNPQVIRYLLGYVAAAQHAIVRDAARALGISDREIDVLTELAHGNSDKQIAQSLFVSESTVKTHLRSIYRKLGVHNRAGAAALAALKGLVVVNQLMRAGSRKRHLKEPRQLTITTSN